MSQASKLLLLAAISLALFTSACNGSSTPAPPSLATSVPVGCLGACPRTYSDFISFSYPPRWHVHTLNTLDAQFSFTEAVLSNVKLHRNCRGRVSPSVCNPRISRLPPDSTLMTWRGGGFAGWTFARARGTLVHLDKRLARVQTIRSRTGCPANTSEQLFATIQRRAKDNWFQLTACYRVRTWLRFARG